MFDKTKVEITLRSEWEKNEKKKRFSVELEYGVEFNRNHIAYLYYISITRFERANRYRNMRYRGYIFVLFFSLHSILKR